MPNRCLHLESAREMRIWKEGKEIAEKSQDLLSMQMRALLQDSMF